MFKFTITDDTGVAHDVTATSRDVVMWERTTRGASLGQLKDAMRYTDLYKIAYFAAKRTGLFDGNETSFVEQFDLEVVAEEDDESADPTQ